MSNNFLVFDVNKLNMLSDSEYISDSERTGGVAQGISRSILFNKVLFQTSSMAAALGTVLSNRGFNAIDNDQEGLVDALNRSFPLNRGLPVSTLIPYTGNYHTVPYGLLLADGTPFPPTAFPELAQAYRVGENTYLYGQVRQPDGSWFPRTPDFRGAFIRGLDRGKGKDPGRSLGIAQGDAIRNITGEAGNYGNGVSDSSPYSSGAMYVRAYTGVPGESEDTQGTSAIYGFDASRVVPTAHENRPYNYAVHYFIVAISGFNLPGGSGSSVQVFSREVTLPASSWSNNTQTISVEGVTSTSYVSVSPKPPLANLKAYGAAYVYASEVQDGSIVFACETVPTTDIIVNIGVIG